MPLSPDAILGVMATFSLAAAAGVWKLATMLSRQDTEAKAQREMLLEVRGQVRHNGGSSLKDDARTAAVEAVAARAAAEVAKEQAAQVASDLVDARDQQAVEAAAHRRALKQVAHDVTTVRAGQELLLGRQDEIEAREARHDQRNKQTIEILQAAVDAGAERDAALAQALHESLDVALAVTEAEGPA